MNKIAIIGAGGFGREVEMLIGDINGQQQTWNFVGYYDDGVAKDKPIGGSKVIGTVKDLEQISEEIYVVIAIGEPKTKRKVADMLEQNQHIKYPVLIHPNC